MKTSQYLTCIVTLLLTALFTAVHAQGNPQSDATKIDAPIEILVKEGYKHLKNDEPDKAMHIYKKAASMVGENPTRNELISYVKALNNIGYIYLFLKNDPEQSYAYLLRAKKIATENEFKDLMGGILDNIAKIRNDFGDAEGAIETYTTALQYAASDSTDVSGVIQLMIFNDLLSCAMANDLTYNINPSLDLFEQLNLEDIPMGRYSKEVCIAMRKMLSGKLLESTDILKNATLLIDSKVDRQRYQVDHKLMLATLYHMRHMPDSAFSLLLDARSTAFQNGLTDKLPRIDKGLGTVLEAQGRNAEANQWFLRAYEIDDSLHNATTYARISTLEPTLDIDLLHKEMRMAEVRHRNRLSTIWILSAAFLLISGLLIMLFLRNRKLRNSYGELAAKHKESIRQAESATRIRHEYEQTIQLLRNETTANETDVKKPIPVTNEERLRIIGAVNDVLEQSPEVTKSDFSLERLSEIVSTKPRYLSAVINESMGKSFSQLLAEARVKKACEMLLSPDFKTAMTVESIALEVGYKSRTQFSAIFKRITGLTPTQYITASK